MQLVTDRLILRRFGENDREALHDVRADPEIGRDLHFHSRPRKRREAGFLIR